MESEFLSSVRKFNIKLVHVLTLFVMSVVNSVCVMCYICGAISQSQISWLRFVQNKEVLMDCQHRVNLRSLNQLEIPP